MPISPVSVPFTSGSRARRPRGELTLYRKPGFSPLHIGESRATHQCERDSYRDGGFSPLHIGESRATRQPLATKARQPRFSPLHIGESRATIPMPALAGASYWFQSPSHRGVARDTATAGQEGTATAFQSPSHRGVARDVTSS